MSSIYASQTFLFDNCRSGRLKFSISNTNFPILKWKYRLLSYPPKAPESTPVMDLEGNIYFGAHDHCVYSLNSSGELRWLWHLDDEKIYSSPAITKDDSILIASGDGFLYKIGFTGKIHWRYHISGFNPERNRIIRKFSKIINARKYFDPDRGKRWTVRCWSSPIILLEDIAVITGFGLGIHAISIENGSSLWTYDLGEPRYHLSGAAINDENEIFVASQQRNLFCIQKDGRLKWHYDTKLPWDAWANPSIDEENQTVFFPISLRESNCKVLALDYRGRLKWEVNLPGAVRGSIAISYQDYVLAACFDGSLYYLHKTSGKIINKTVLSNASRALWTTPAIDPKGNIFITTKDDSSNGSLTCISPSGEIFWKYKTGKSLSTPILDGKGLLYIGNWNGELLCLDSNKKITNNE